MKKKKKKIITKKIKKQKKVRKIIIGIKYNQENKRLLQAQIKAFEIEKARFPELDQQTRWSSTYYMLKNFLHLWEPIKAVINSSNSKAFKNKNNLLLGEIEIMWLENVLAISAIFVKATTKLQAEKYPTIYYIMPEDKVFINAINSGIAMLRKYYSKTGVLDNKSKSFYLSIIFNPRIKEEGLKAISISTGFILDIIARLRTDFNSYKLDYLRESPITNEDGDLNIYDDDDDELGIFAENDKDFKTNELTAYLKEKRSPKHIN
ncbi:hypothetical protein DL98DRAFT_542123 [Cadophora sp. DSE1049]|nr:hypothetical protein DL98DRAFT_542123 [Cadophora sp. DSE1049]